MDYSKMIEAEKDKLFQLGYEAVGFAFLSPDEAAKYGFEVGSYYAVIPYGTEFDFNHMDRVPHFIGPRPGRLYDAAEVVADLQEAVRWVEPRSYQKRMEQVGLIGAVKMGDIEAVRWVLAHGADANAKDNVGWTALLYAQENHYLDIVKVLIDKGADVNMGDNNRRTALICASRLGDVDIVKALLASGADVNAKDNVGWTALNQAYQQFHESSGYEGYKEIIQLLKQAGARE